MTISPDEGSMNRAIYLANVLGVDMGMYYKASGLLKICKRPSPDRSIRIPRTKDRGQGYDPDR